ncbi:MAG: sialidase family protein [Thermoplasmatota archaeon]
MRSLLAVTFAALVLFAGCIAPGSKTSPASVAGSAAVLPALAFTAQKLVSPDHAGGEPAIVMTPKGTLLYASHPGYTHNHGLPPSADLITSTTYESYMWRSTDNGATWHYVGTLGQEMGPRGLARGVSDPDFTVDATGRVFFTDLNALATDSVGRSDDDGMTWLFGNPAAQQVIDRQWIAAYKTSVWISGDTSATPSVSRSDDGGVTWIPIGNKDLSGKMTADPRDGTLYIGGGSSIDVSKDGGVTWKVSSVPGHKSVGQGHDLTEVAIDPTGTVYTAWSEGSSVWYAASPDKGATWPVIVKLTDAWTGATVGTHLWPWVTAGDAGRIGVVWYAADEAAKNAEDVKGDWFVEAAVVENASSAMPSYTLSKATGAIHKGPICLGGTGCETDQTSDQTDRRLGDLFEATVDKTGELVIAYSDTVTVPGDTISHPGFVRETAGPSLYAPDHKAPTAAAS